MEGGVRENRAMRRGTTVIIVLRRRLGSIHPALQRGWSRDEHSRSLSVALVERLLRMRDAENRQDAD